MKFTKMHGCGNDYVYVNCLEEKINNPNKVAKFISDRHFDLDEVIDQPVIVDGKEYNITCISMGNPHGVVFVDSVADIDIEKIGPKFENHPMFPDRVNTEFIELVDDKTIKMRVWERGAGETLACGTGACASAYASYLNKKTGKKVLVHLLGGDLQIEYDEEKDTIFMTGPATTVFDGEIDLTGIDD